MEEEKPERKQTGTPVRSASQPEGFYGALGRTIKVLRTAHGLGRRDLAEAAGLSYSYLAEIENGAKQPSSKALLTLAEALGVPASELMQAAESWSSSEQEELDSAGRELARTSMAVASYDAELEQSALPRRVASWPRRPRRWAPTTAMVEEESRHDSARLSELAHLINHLSPEDLERVLDLARRLADDRG